MNNTITVVMAKTAKGSLDGLRTTEYLKNKTYDITPELAGQFRLMNVLASEFENDSNSDLTDKNNTVGKSPAAKITTPENGNAELIETASIKKTKPRAKRAI